MFWEQGNKAKQYVGERYLQSDKPSHVRLMWWHQVHCDAVP